MKPRETLVLSRKAIAKVMSFGDYVDAVEGAFGRYQAGAVDVPAVVHTPGDGGAFHVKSAGFLAKPRYVAVKVNGNFPENQKNFGLPTIQGAVVLCDGSNGALLAILDSIEITAMRTGAATAVAAKYLADPKTHTATIIGCGTQGYVQLDALMHGLPITTVYAFDVDPERAEYFAVDVSQTKGVKSIAVKDFRKGTLKSSAIVTCTSSKKWFLSKEHVNLGTFIAAVGADNDDKQEIDPALLAQSLLVTDITAQCVTIGELHHALESGVMRDTQVYAELGEIVAGKVAPPKINGNIVVFDSTGSAIQDAAAAGVIFERAVDQELGLSIGFGS